MAENKTQKTQEGVMDFINAVEDERKRADSMELLQLMEQVSGQQAVMWGPSIIGVGDHHYKYESGREGDFFKIGFSPRKAAISLYLMGSSDKKAPLLEKLGKHKTGKSCIYIKKLDDIDRSILRELLAVSWKGAV